MGSHFLIRENQRGLLLYPYEVQLCIICNDKGFYTRTYMYLSPSYAQTNAHSHNLCVDQICNRFPIWIALRNYIPIFTRVPYFSFLQKHHRQLCAIESTCSQWGLCLMLTSIRLTWARAEASRLCRYEIQRRIPFCVRVYVCMILYRRID